MEKKKKKNRHRGGTRGCGSRKKKSRWVQRQGPCPGRKGTGRKLCGGHTQKKTGGKKKTKKTHQTIY